jgi:hypothetical protein
MSELRYRIGERRICWPQPDATCLHGGCGHCNDQPFRPLPSIERFARDAGVLPHRATGQEDALNAFRYGLENAFFDTDTRASLSDLVAYGESIGGLALAEMAEGMPGGSHGKKRDDVLAYVLSRRRADLDESFRLTRRGSWRPEEIEEA